jgi:hypothetical protein
VLRRPEGRLAGPTGYLTGPTGDLAAPKGGSPKRTYIVAVKSVEIDPVANIS